MPNNEFTVNTPSRRQKIGIGIAAITAILIAIATLTPVEVVVYGPGGDAPCLICGELGGTDALLNTLLFIPLGFGLALAGVRASRTIAASVLSSGTIEVLQFGIIAGRDASMGDVLTNSLGGALGVLLANHFLGLVLPRARRAQWLCVIWSALFLAVQGISSYGLHPLATHSLYFGQTSRSLNEVPPFSGRVLFAAVDGVPMLAATSEAQSERIRKALVTRQGATAEARVVPGPPVPVFTTIFRVADRKEREIVALSAEGTTVMYGVRSGAAVLLLRPVLFAARDALRPAHAEGLQSAGDSMHLGARWAADAVTIEHGNAGNGAQKRLRITSAAGWRLVAPFRVLVEGSPLDALLDAGWLMLLLFPFGYWGASAWSATEPRRGVFATGSVVLVVVALLIGPVLFGEAFPAWWEIAGAITGVTLGARGGLFVARRFRTPVDPGAVR